MAPSTSQPKGQSMALNTESHLSGWRLYVIIACLFFGSFLIALDINIINVALPRISSEFGALQDIGWYGSAYLLTITAFQAVYGAWYKFFSTKVVYCISIAVFEVGSVLCAAAVNSNMFIVGRAIAGFGAAGVLQGALSIINRVVPLPKRPFYMAVVISVFVISVTVGPVLGGCFTEKVTWRWCFWINLPIGAVVLIGLFIFLRIKDSGSQLRSLPLYTKLKHMDPLGCVLIMGTVICLLLALQMGGQTRPWSSSEVIGCLVGAVVTGLLFVVWQWKAAERALIPLRVLRKRSIWTGAMTLFCLGAQAYLNTFFLPFWFQGVKGQSPVQTGLDFIALLLPQFAALIIVGAVVKKYGYYVPYMLVGEVITIGGQAMLAQLHPQTRTLYWASSLVVTGIGCGMAMQLPYTAVAVVLADDDIPTGNAIAVLFYQLGGAISISIGQTVTVTSLLDLVASRLPNLSPRLVVAAGAANLPSLASDEVTLTILREIWNTAISRTIYIGVAAAIVTIPFTFCMDWLNAVQVAGAREQMENQDEAVPPVNLEKVASEYKV